MCVEALAATDFNETSESFLAMTRISAWERFTGPWISLSCVRCFKTSGFRSSGMWLHFTGCLIPDVSRQHGGLLFKARNIHELVFTSEFSVTVCSIRSGAICGTWHIHSSLSLFSRLPVSFVSWTLTWSSLAVPFIYLNTLVKVVSGIFVGGLRRRKMKLEEIKCEMQSGSKWCRVSSGGILCPNFHKTYFSTSWVTVNFSRKIVYNLLNVFEVHDNSKLRPFYLWPDCLPYRVSEPPCMSCLCLLWCFYMLRYVSVSGTRSSHITAFPVEFAP